MRTAAEILAVFDVLAWGYLLILHGGFWLTRERDEAAPEFAGPWPSVVAVVPARNEADVIGRALASLLAQDYAGDLRIVLVDDGSADGTAEAARVLDDPRLEVVAGAPLPAGWTGKLWAVSQGIERSGAPDFLWLTDADIAHAPDALSTLVAGVQAKGLVLSSRMARLMVTSEAERWLIPAFVLFFAMLFPFAWANDPRRRTAAAAGGCMLVRREALEAAGGIAAIRGQIIDDVALARLMKPRGPIRLSLTDRATSLRPYGSWRAIGAMVARSAYAQLGYSPPILAGTVIGLTAIFLAPPFLALFTPDWPRLAGAACWLAMAAAFVPMLRFYRLGLWRAALLPAIALLYLVFTLASAVQVWRGAGGRWKGRSQAMAAAP